MLQAQEFIVTLIKGKGYLLSHAWLLLYIILPYDVTYTWTLKYDTNKLTYGTEADSET